MGKGSEATLQWILRKQLAELVHGCDPAGGWELEVGWKEGKGWKERKKEGRAGEEREGREGCREGKKEGEDEPVTRL